eukprot:13125190-Heterocapsa_arctica.AAC.2
MCGPYIDSDAATWSHSFVDDLPSGPELMSVQARLRAETVAQLRSYSEAAATARDEERKEACEEATARATGDHNMAEEISGGGDDAAGGVRADGERGGGGRGMGDGRGRAAGPSPSPAQW